MINSETRKEKKKKVMESNDLMRTGRTKGGGPEQEGDVRDEGGAGGLQPDWESHVYQRSHSGLP